MTVRHIQSETWSRSPVSKPSVITLTLLPGTNPHAGRASSKQSLWLCKEWTLENPYCEVLLYYNCVFVRRAHQQRLMQSVNFRYLCCIGNTSAPLHLLLRSWLLKVDSKHRLCWLSACLYIRTQIVGRLTAFCCQSNKSYPLWPHLLVNAVELWTVMSFIWFVCHRHFLSQVPPLCRPPSVPSLYVFSFPIKRKSYPETACAPS